jgi:hypothetical protein
MTRPLLIGEAPAATTPEGWPPFYGRERSAKRLWQLGFRVSRGLARIGNVDAINLLADYPGKKWPAKTAAEIARLHLKDGLYGRREVLLVGRNVATAFEMSDKIAAALKRSEPIVRDALKLGRSISGADPDLGLIR